MIHLAAPLARLCHRLNGSFQWTMSFGTKLRLRDAVGRKSSMLSSRALIVNYCQRVIDFYCRSDDNFLSGCYIVPARGHRRSKSPQIRPILQLWLVNCILILTALILSFVVDMAVTFVDHG